MSTQELWSGQDVIITGPNIYGVTAHKGERVYLYATSSDGYGSVEFPGGGLSKYPLSSLTAIPPEPQQPKAGQVWEHDGELWLVAAVGYGNWQIINLNGRYHFGDPAAPSSVSCELGRRFSFLAVSLKDAAALGLL